jgi:hypothetical protein
MVQTNKDTKVFNDHYQQNPRQALLAQKERLKDDKAFQLYRAPDLAKEDYAYHQEQAKAIVLEVGPLNRQIWHQDPAIMQQNEERYKALIEKSTWNPYVIETLQKRFSVHLKDLILQQMKTKQLVHCMDMLHSHTGIHPPDATKDILDTLFAHTNSRDDILTTMAHTHPDHHAAITQWHTHEEHLENERRHVRVFDMDR